MPRDSESYTQVSLVLPFQLKLKYSEVRLTPIMKKLRGLSVTVRHQRKMRISIFVSPLIERIFYFNQTPQKSNYYLMQDKISRGCPSTEEIRGGN